MSFPEFVAALATRLVIHLGQLMLDTICDTSQTGTRKPIPMFSVKGELNMKGIKISNQDVEDIKIAVNDCELSGKDLFKIAKICAKSMFLKSRVKTLNSTPSCQMCRKDRDGQATRSEM